MISNRTADSSATISGLKILLHLKQKISECGMHKSPRKEGSGMQLARGERILDRANLKKLISV